MKKLLAGIILLFASGVAYAGEDVTVTWTAPADVDALEYDGYWLYYTDSSGEQFKLRIDGKASSSVVVPDVPFGESQWWMTSTCAVCTTTESNSSQIVDFTVKSKGVPSAPSLTISLGN